MSHKKGTCTAWLSAESEGMGASGCKTKEQAVVEMNKELAAIAAEDLIEPKVATVENVIETRLYKHRRCNTGTVGDSSACYECGEPHMSNGSRIFYFSFV